MLSRLQKRHAKSCVKFKRQINIALGCITCTGPLTSGTHSSGLGFPRRPPLILRFTLD
ncbi:hypothetical protein BJX66DRAFT_317352 [Aspergillus keveii]|uniref:Uncharacterized protein n=1 Tax=Aspergillus keveii TaxID=714993 RepID=A0ABR4FLI0_9EURO